jgi:hypothetical protein
MPRELASGVRNSAVQQQRWMLLGSSCETSCTSAVATHQIRSESALGDSGGLANGARFRRASFGTCLPRHLPRLQLRKRCLRRVRPCVLNSQDLHHIWL